MKTSKVRILTALSAVLLAEGLFVSQTAQAADLFQYLTQSLGKVVAFATVANLGDFDYAPGNSLLGVYLYTGQSQELKTSVDAGIRYKILVAGDEDILDVDAVAKTVAGRTLDEDADSTALAVLDFTPTETGPITIEIKNYASLRPGFCAAVILRQSKGGQLSLRELLEALRNALRSASVAGLFSVRFATGTFCLFGGRLAPGQESTLTDIRLPSGRYFVTSGASDSVSAVNLFVLRQPPANGLSAQTVALDTDFDSSPVCQFEAKRGETYLIRHKNNERRAGASGFVFTCVLQK